VAAAKSPRSLLLALALLLKFDVIPSAEVNALSVQALTFIEVSVEARGHSANALREQVNALREHRASAGQIIAMQEIARPERFAVLERETPAVLTAQETHALTESFTADLIAPPDQRLNRELEESTSATGQQVNAPANFYVVTHVDIVTPDRSRVETALRKLTAAARQSDGNLGVEILQQIDRPNHFNLICAWLSESAFHAFAASSAAREFRQAVGPVLGSPYDERLFRRVD
jgi:quinol monooxygenase YgiN